MSQMYPLFIQWTGRKPRQKRKEEKEIKGIQT
jgi:hypothetical protein